MEPADATRALRLLDLTDLAEGANEAGLAALCKRALLAPGPVAAVCIWPRFVAAAKHILEGSGVRVATVVNFPGGGGDSAPVLAETLSALASGADEIDLVLPWRAFLAGDTETASAMVRTVKATCGAARLKVILETGEYPDSDAIAGASRLAIGAGADFIKTSTGKTARSATTEAARIMLEAIRDSGRPVGLKPSGGIRRCEDAAAYLALADAVMGPQWATAETFRFGASGLHQALLDAFAGTRSGGSTERY